MINFFDIFQLVSLCIFLALFIGRSVWLHKNGTTIFVIGKGKGGVKAFIEIIFITILVLWLFEIIKNALHFSFSILPDLLSDPVIDNTLLKVAGLITITTGLIIFILALISFGRSWRIGIDTNNPGKLVTSGIFSKTRNPVFVFFNLYFTGTALIYTNIFFAGLAIMAVLGIHFHILNEEKFLKNNYGKPYVDYCKKVNRYF